MHSERAVHPRRSCRYCCL